MKNLIAAATIVASLGLAPVALAAGLGPEGARADTSTTAPDRNQSTGSASAALQGYTTSGPGMAQANTSTPIPDRNQSTGSASAALQGYTTSGPGGTPVTIVATGGSSFNWGDVGIGAAGAIGMTLVLIGIGLVVLRRRSRLAV
jgi:hypothetical protein